MMMLLLALCGASIAFGQDDKHNAVQIMEVPNSVVELSFAGGWDVEEKDEMVIATSPDGKVRLAATAIKANSLNLALNVGKTFCEQWMRNFNFSKELGTKKSGGLQIATTGGSAKDKGDDEPLNFDLDFIAVEKRKDDKFVVLVSFGSEEAMSDNAADIEMTRKSFKKTN